MRLQYERSSVHLQPIHHQKLNMHSAQSCKVTQDALCKILQLGSTYLCFFQYNVKSPNHFCNINACLNINYNKTVKYFFVFFSGSSGSDVQNSVGTRPWGSPCGRRGGGGRRSEGEGGPCRRLQGCPGRRSYRVPGARCSEARLRTSQLSGPASKT